MKDTFVRADWRGADLQGAMMPGPARTTARKTLEDALAQQPKAKEPEQSKSKDRGIERGGR